MAAELLLAGSIRTCNSRHCLTPCANTRSFVLSVTNCKVQPLIVKLSSVLIFCYRIDEFYTRVPIAVPSG